MLTGESEPPFFNLAYATLIVKRSKNGKRIEVKMSARNPLTTLPIPTYNGGKSEYPLISPNEPTTARFVVRVHVGELPENCSGYRQREIGGGGGNA